MIEYLPRCRMGQLCNERINIWFLVKVVSSVPQPPIHHHVECVFFCVQVSTLQAKTRAMSCDKVTAGPLILLPFPYKFRCRLVTWTLIVPKSPVP